MKSKKFYVRKIEDGSREGDMYGRYLFETIRLVKLVTKPKMSC